MANLVLAFAELLVGGIVLEAGIKGAKLGDVVTGKATQSPLPGAGGASGAGPSAPGQPGVTGGSTPFSKDATSSRLDMGQDLTSKVFNAPLSGRIIQADQSNAGWAGGGVVTLLLDTPIRLADGTLVRALYWAEGIAPTVNVGQHVSAGEQIAIPRANPYNGTVGSIEWGPAAASSGPQHLVTLAQAVSNSAAVIRAWYQWALSIGAPSASSTGHAGFA